MDVYLQDASSAIGGMTVIDRFIQADPDWGHPDTHSSDMGEMDFSAEHTLSIPIKNKQEKKNNTQTTKKTNSMPSCYQ